MINKIIFGFSNWRQYTRLLPKDKGYIYKIHFPNGKLYIGASYRISGRISEHIRAIKNGKYSYGKEYVKNNWSDNFLGLEIINTCLVEDLAIYEQQSLEAHPSELLYNKIYFTDIPILDTRVIKRIFDKITITKDEHWIWNGSMTGDGYGGVKIKGKTYLVHRVMKVYSLRTIGYGEQLEKGYFIGHRADCPKKCCNPDHLSVITHKENVDYNRMCESTSQRQISDNVVFSIRRDWNDGILTRKDISGKYHLPIDTVHKILQNRIYKDANWTPSLRKTSEYQGVSYYKSNNRWVAKIRHNGKDKHLGYFNSEIEAAASYDNYLAKHKYLLLKDSRYKFNFNHEEKRKEMAIDI